MPALDAIFLDRDGTLNVPATSGSYVCRPDELQLLPGSSSAVARLNHAGILVIVTTNQRGVALGRMTLEDVRLVNSEMENQLSAGGAHLDAIYVCPHDNGTCDCRKPLPGLLLRAARDFPGLRLERCAMIGDTESDVQAASAAGARAVRLGLPGTCSAAEVVVEDLPAAVAHLLGPTR